MPIRRSKSSLSAQLAVLKREHPRPPLHLLDRLFWTVLRQTWARWKEVPVILKPETVTDWHRAGFRLYWRWRSRPRGGRPRITEEIRVLIRRIAHENPDWGAPKIHGELQRLGVVVSESTVARYLRRPHRRGDPAKRWLAFLRNHPGGHRRLGFVHRAHGNLSGPVLPVRDRARTPPHPALQRHATSDGGMVVQQLREAFPEVSSYRYVILDRDAIFNADAQLLKATGLQPRRTSHQAPWQNGTAERWIGSRRREILDHVIALAEQHLRRVIGDYVCYYEQDRIHDSLDKNTPNRRPVESRPAADATVVSLPRLGGLHHRYAWRLAA